MPSLVCHSQHFRVEGLDPQEFQQLVEKTGFHGSSEAPSTPSGLFEFSRVDGYYRLESEDKVVCSGQPLDLAIELVRSRIHRHINSIHPETTFLQADTVRWTNGRAILIVGPSISGKTTLAKALIRAGGELWSEHFAVLTNESTILPFPRPDIASEGIPVGAIIRAPFRPNAVWEPKSMTAGESVLRMMEVVGDTGGMTPTTMPQLAKLAGQAELRLAGERGETDSVVACLREHAL